MAPTPRRILASTLAASLLATGVGALIPSTASAAVTQLFNQSFANPTADGEGAVVLPAPAAVGATNVACLTAAGGTTGSVRSCTGTTDAAGSGKLRLTDNTGSRVGGLFAAASVPTSSGLDVTFNTYQWGTTATPADGITFALAAVDPANPVSPANIGPVGGSLGYSSTGTTTKGLAYGYLGIGLDVYGNFSNAGFQGSGCTTPGYISATGLVKGQVVVRGPGNNTTGYCALNSTATSTTSPAVALRAATRAASKVPVEVVINPAAASITSPSGIPVPAKSYAVQFTPVGGTARTLTGTLPTVSSALYPASYLDANGYPKQLAFGFVASTGGSVDYHEIDSTKVVSLSAVPELSVSHTAYAESTLAVGDPVTYVVKAGVQQGLSETAPISVTETLPAGVKPLAGHGTGWTCAAPIGQKITCTNSATPVAAGSTLPDLIITSTVTANGTTPAVIRSSSQATAQSSDGSPAIASAAFAGTPPAAPTNLVLSPISGPAGSPVAITGTNLAGASAVQIGTAAEINAGTASTLTPCPNNTAAAGCFTVNATTGAISISAMPVHAAGAVQVKVITLGAAGTVGYTYTSAPGTPAVSARAGVLTATATWDAPASGGSAITAYTVTPYKDGVAQTPVSLGAGVTTYTVANATAGASYSFTVSARNSLGTGAASARTDAVIPYTVPGAPTVVAAVAGTKGATLSWTAPVANGFSPITGYVVTPYLDGVAQTAQTLDSTATTRTLTGLAGGGSYSFTVAATNAAGTGPASARSTAVTVNDVPGITSTPGNGTVGEAYRHQLTASGGTGATTFAVSSGSLPDGLSVTSAGLITGTPTAAGSSTFTVRVTDADGGSSTRVFTVLVAKAPAGVTLAVSDPTVTLGASVDLTATLDPVAVSGPVAFTVTGPDGTSTEVGSDPVSGGEARVTTTLSAFGRHTVVARYAGDATHLTAISPAKTIEVRASAGQAIVTELRSSGPGGADDSYAEIYNPGDPVPLAGFVLTSGSGARTELPADAPVLGTHRTYLVAGPDFSLGTVATPDQVADSLGTDGFSLVAPDTAGTVTDAVGPGAGLHLGSALPNLSGTPTEQHAFVRIERGGRPVNTGQNADDFALVSSTGGTVGGVQSIRGSASPTGLGDAWQHNEQAASYLLDGSTTTEAVPNRAYVVGTPGTLEIRRTITNTGTSTITEAKARVTALSEANGLPYAGTSPARVALIRAVNPRSATSQVAVAGRGTVTVRNLRVDAPISAAAGGGLNSTLTVPLPEGGLAPGASVDVAFTFDVDTRGTFWFGYDVDARTASTARAAKLSASKVASKLAESGRTPATAVTKAATGTL